MKLNLIAFIENKDPILEVLERDGRLTFEKFPWQGRYVYTFYPRRFTWTEPDAWENPDENYVSGLLTWVPELQNFHYEEAFEEKENHLGILAQQLNDDLPNLVDKVNSEINLGDLSGIPGLVEVFLTFSNCAAKSIRDYLQDR